MDLTWEELQKAAMIGEPVWSRAKRKWFLLTDSALDFRSWVDLTDANGKQIRIIEHDLKDYQLVRKKEEI